jgi:tungstate transport system ATP-binding protein
MSGWVQLKGVDLRYGAVHALAGVDLRIAPGERVALIGANGSGKSTLLRVLHGLLRPSAGTVLRDGAMRQAMVFQRPWMLRASVWSNVALSLWIRGHRWREAKAQALTSLARVGLSELAFRNARTLSWGQQQRLALARAWSLRPDVLLLDEPTSALDPISTAKIEELITELKNEYTIAIVTHNMQQAARVSDYTAYMYLGELIEFGDTDQIFLKPKRKETEDYITGRFG